MVKHNPPRTDYDVQALEIFEKMPEYQQRLFYPRRIIPTPGYLHPKGVAMVAATGYFPAPDYLKRSNDAKVLALIQHFWVETGSIQFLLSPALFGAVMNTSVAETIDPTELHAPLQSMLFALPLGMLSSPVNGGCMTLGIVRIHPSETSNRFVVRTYHGRVGFEIEEGAGEGYWGIHTMTDTGVSFGILLPDSRVPDYIKGDLMLDRYIVFSPFDGSPMGTSHMGAETEEDLNDSQFLKGLMTIAINLLVALNCRKELFPTEDTLERPQKVKKGRVVREALWHARRVGWDYKLQTRQQGGHSHRHKLTAKERDGRPLIFVRGHVRNQPYGPRTDPRHRPIWIEPYVRVV